MNNINNRLWEMANKMRSKSSMEPNEFKNYILGIMFYKFISDNVESFYKKELKEELKKESLKYFFNDKDNADTLIKEAKENFGYALDYDSLFSTMIKKAKNEEYSNSLFQNAIKFFNNNINSKEDFSDLFSDLRFDDPRLGKEQREKNNVISSIMFEINEIEKDSFEFSVDVLGDAYEYLISKFASNAGKKAGEFYTPQSVSKLMAKIVTLNNKDIKYIYDPTCGSGSLLLRIAKELHSFGQEYGTLNGQELVTTTYNLARMNMIIHNINFQDFHIAQGNTILKPNKEIAKKKYDVIVSNPPYGTKWESPRYLLDDRRFYSYGAIAPKGAMELSFVQHIENYLSDKGIAAILLPVGVLFRRGPENKILKYLINNKYLESIILLPTNMFNSTSIPVICMVIKKCNEKEGVFMIDASDQFVKENKKHILEEIHIEKIMELYKNREETQISKHLSLKEIQENGYNLNVTRYIKRYVEEEIDIDELGKEIKSNLKKIRLLEENIINDIGQIKDLLK